MKIRFVLTRWDGEQVEQAGWSPAPFFLRHCFEVKYETPVTMRHPDPTVIAMPSPIDFRLVRIVKDDEEAIAYYDEVL